MCVNDSACERGAERKWNGADRKRVEREQTFQKTLERKQSVERKAAERELTERRAGVTKIGLSAERQIGRSRSAHVLRPACFHSVRITIHNVIDHELVITILKIIVTSMCYATREHVTISFGCIGSEV